MTIALVHDHYDQKHLDVVKAEMLIWGAPVIKAVWMECYQMYAALEGCHRIRAAYDLGLTPTIAEFDYDDVCDLELCDERLGLDIDSAQKVSWLIDGCNNSVTFNFKA